jgi:hypothetical protein
MTRNSPMLEAVDRSLAPQLRIAFPPPGFFLADARLVILLNAHVVYAGSFKQGVELSIPVAPGEHVVSTRIEIDALTRTRDYPITIPPGEAFSVILSYSRFWGNFTKKPTVLAHR